MRKNIFIFSGIILTFGLTAFTYLDWNNTRISDNQCKGSDCAADLVFTNKSNPFYHEVGTRFYATITVDKLNEARTIADLVPEGSTAGIVSFKDVKIGLLPRKRSNIAMGQTGELSVDQVRLLAEASYSTDFYIEAFCDRGSQEANNKHGECFVYYITVVPENQAKYEDGNDALVAYIAENIQQTTSAFDMTKLEPGKIRFKVTKDGDVSDLNLEATCGYDKIDEAMLDLLKTLPKGWKPATNKQNNPVDQELVYSFGKIGC